MRRAILIVIVPLVVLGLAALVSASEPAPPPPEADDAVEVTDDGYCKNWCCRRVCTSDNKCYRHCWCCG
jgi:hypothetical protein